MTVPARVTSFLKTQKPKAYCDACIAKALTLGAGSNRSMARNATSVLAQTKEFRRFEGSCSQCRQVRLVISAI